MGIDGHPLPGGQYRIAAAENAALCAAVGAAPEPDGRAHPIFYYIASQVGMGIGVDGLLALCEFDVADGPMMTKSSVTFAEELRVEETYRVEGEILSLVRKPSRTFGTADTLRFRLALTAPDDRRVLECVSEWILPRGGEMPS
jgi:hypothetical protein